MKIKCICLSDLHLGEEDSLLTNIERKENDWRVDVCKSSPVMDGLLDVLTDVTERSPTFAIAPLRQWDDRVSAAPWTIVTNPLGATPLVDVVPRLEPFLVLNIG